MSEKKNYLLDLILPFRPSQWLRIEKDETVFFVELFSTDCTTYLVIVQLLTAAIGLLLLLLLVLFLCQSAVGAGGRARERETDRQTDRQTDRMMPKLALAWTKRRQQLEAPAAALNAFLTRQRRLCED